MTYKFVKEDKDFRKLKKKEIEFLKSHGCISQSWDKILIKNVDIKRIKMFLFMEK